jgi:hypothetical protein
VRVKVLQTFVVDLELDRNELFMGPGENGTVNVTVTNLGNGPDVIEVWVPVVKNLTTNPESLELAIGPADSRAFQLVVSPDVAKDMEKNIWVKARSKGDPGMLVEASIDVYVTT